MPDDYACTYELGSNTISSPFPDLQVCGSSVSADSTYVQHMNIEGTSKSTIFLAIFSCMAVK